MAERLLSLGARLRAKDGRWLVLGRGDEAPADVNPEELDRLRRQGAYGEPPAAPTTHASDIVAADEGSLAEFVNGNKTDGIKGATPKEIETAVGNDPELATRVLNHERDGRNRKSVVKHLEEVIEGERPPESVEPDPTVPPAPPA